MITNVDAVTIAAPLRKNISMSPFSSPKMLVRAGHRRPAPRRPAGRGPSTCRLGAAAAPKYVASTAMPIAIEREAEARTGTPGWPRGRARSSARRKGSATIQNARPFQPMRLFDGLRDVTDGAHDVQVGDAPRREGDGEERQHDAQAVRDDQRAQRDVRRERQAERREERRGCRGQRERDAARRARRRPRPTSGCSRCLRRGTSRSGGRRFVPTARAMPISDFRSAASMTKIITISSMPAPIEKRPSTRKNVVMKLPISRRRRTRSCFVSLTSMRRLLSATISCFDLGLDVARDIERVADAAGCRRRGSTSSRRRRRIACTTDRRRDHAFVGLAVDRAGEPGVLDDGLDRELAARRRST